MPKVYAVRKGRTNGLFADWPTCQAQVKGYKGAQFKSFGTKAEALVYLGASVEDIKANHASQAANRKRAAEEKQSNSSKKLKTSASNSTDELLSLNNPIDAVIRDKKQPRLELYVYILSI